MQEKVEELAKKKYWVKFRELILFGIGGFVAYGLNFFIPLFLVEELKFNYLIAVSITQIIIFIYGFTYNLKVTFKVQFAKLQLFKFLAVLLTASLGNVLLVFFFTEVVGLFYLISIAVSVFAFTAFKFFSYKLWVFPKKISSQDSKIDFIQVLTNFLRNFICYLEEKHKFIVVGFFILVGLVGVFIYQDYGISVDEQIQRDHALVSAKYIAEIFYPPLANSSELVDKPELSEYTHKHYGVAFHLPLLFVEKLLGFDDGPSNELWEFRHFATFSFFFLSTMFFYKILLERFKNWKIALLGTLMLYLSPRIFAESFYNIKDLVFLSAFIIASYFSINLIKEKNWLNLWLASISIAFAINIRILGLILPMTILGFFVFDLIKNKSQLKYKLLKILIFSIATFGFTILFWPAAWSAPIDVTIEGFTKMSNYDLWDNYIIFMGELIKGSEVPWYYIPVWIAITTPINNLVLFLFGSIFVIFKLFKKNGFRLYTTLEEKTDLFMLLVFLGPIVAIIIFSSTLYGGWRHLYFIHGAYVYLAIYGVVSLFNVLKSKVVKRSTSISLRLVVVGLIALNMVHTCVWMIQNHPYQYVYFNTLAGDVDNNFDRDIWRVAGKDALINLLEITGENRIRVAEINATKRSYLMLDKNQQSRIELVGLLESEYFIEDYRNVQGESKFSGEVLSIWVDDFKIVSVMQTDQNEELMFLRAAKNNELDWIKNYILEGGADINLNHSYDSQTALSVAISEKNQEVVFFLLDQGADPNQVYSNRRTPIMTAVYFNQPETVRKLLQFGADPVQEDVYGRSACDRINDETDPEIVSLLDICSSK